MKLRLIRNATSKISYAGQCILFDPYFAEKFTLPSYTGKSKNPLVDLPVAIEEILENVDMTIVSHIHSDHFDSVAQSSLNSDMPIVCQCKNKKEIEKLGFKNVTAIKENYQWRNINIKRIDAKHGSGCVLMLMGKTSGFLFKAVGEPTVYWTGDTILCDEVRQVLLTEKPDIVITHSCGAVWGKNVKIVMDEVQTVEVCKLLPNSIIVAIHMEALDHGTVSRSELRKYAKENGIEDKKLIILNDGESFSLNI